MRDMALGYDALWVVGDPADRRVFKVNPKTGQIVHVTMLPFAPRSIAAGEGGVWVTGSIDDVVGRLDPETGRLTATVPVPPERAASPPGREGSGWRAAWRVSSVVSTRVS